jgi:hypothetical protein
MFRLAITVQAGRLELDKKLLRATLRSAGNEVAATARGLIRAGGPKMPKQRRPASKPGQPPMNQTGKLAAGLVVRVYRNGEGVQIIDTARSAKGSGAPYALFLEKGARNFGPRVHNFGRRVNARKVADISKRELLPRPFMSAALDKVSASLVPRLAASVNQGMKFVKGPKP